MRVRVRVHVPLRAPGSVRVAACVRLSARTFAPAFTRYQAKPSGIALIHTPKYAIPLQLGRRRVWDLVGRAYLSKHARRGRDAAHFDIEHN